MAAVRRVRADDEACRLARCLMGRRRPYPELGDTPLRRARGIARAYREHLKVKAPDLCAALDDAAQDAGEAWWLIEQIIHVNPDDLIGTTAAAELAHVRPATVRQWRKRGFVDRHGNQRKLEPKTRDHRGWPLFLTEDVLEAATATRRRRPR